MDQYDCIAPLDARYAEDAAPLGPYLSENAFTRYKLKVELALVKALAKLEIIPENLRERAIKEVRTACEKVTTAEVSAEEKWTKHDIVALVNCICKYVSDEVKPYIHMFATSYDIVENANAARYRDAVRGELLPQLQKFLEVLIDLTLREKDTVQIGRTHGQHAVPITVGFAFSEYVSRIGNSILEIKRHTENLRGKFSGAVGAYNTTALFLPDPLEFERLVLKEMQLEPAEASTQINMPEPIARLLLEIITMASILANLADDMRHLQRTEIAEVGEPFEKGQVGSSAMPPKQNPINFENVKSMWKILVGRAMTIHLDLISEHQRDLTNSASGRTYGEIIAYAFLMVQRMTRVMAKLTVNKENLQRNLMLQGDLIGAEPFQNILRELGHPKAHEVIRVLSIQARQEKKSLWDLAESDPQLAPYLERMTAKQKAVIQRPWEKYTGIAAQKAEHIALKWQEWLQLN